MGGGAVLLSGLLKSNGYTTGALSSLVREREASYELQVSAVTADDFFFFSSPNPLPGISQCEASASCGLCLKFAHLKIAELSLVRLIFKQICRG